MKQQLSTKYMIILTSIFPHLLLFCRPCYACIQYNVTAYKASEASYVATLPICPPTVNPTVAMPTAEEELVQGPVSLNSPPQPAPSRSKPHFNLDIPAGVGGIHLTWLFCKCSLTVTSSHSDIYLPCSEHCRWKDTERAVTTAQRADKTRHRVLRQTFSSPKRHGHINRRSRRGLQRRNRRQSKSSDKQVN